MSIASQVSNLCVTVGGSWQNGSPLQMEKCDHALDAQRWQFEDDQIKFTADLTMCVDVPSSLANGDNLRLWECTGTENQKWGYDEFAHSIFSESATEDASMCVDLIGGSTKSDAAVGIWSCDNSDDNQKWYTTRSLPAPWGAFANAASNTCLDVPGEIKNGQELWMWECTGQDNQNWQFANGNLQFLKDPSKCVAVNPYSASSEGYRLQIWDCKTTPPLLWNFNYDDRTIVLSGNQEWCMDAMDGQGKNGAVVQAIKCDGQNKQKWQSP